MKNVLFVLLILAFLVSAASAQEKLAIVSAEECGDGVSATLNVSLSENEVLIVGWAYVNEVYGVSANQVVLTGLESGEQEIVIPHLGVPEGHETFFGVLILDTTNMEMLPDILSGLAMEANLEELEVDEEDVMELLEQVPAAGEVLTVGDCTIEGKTPTVSNVEIDFEALLAELEGLMDE